MLTENDYNQLIEKIKNRPEENFTGYWFNLIKHKQHSFIQGNISRESTLHDINRNLACLVENINSQDIQGVWPQVMGHPICEEEEELLVDYLSHQGNNDIELIVPERNLARPVDWFRFDETPEYNIYKTYIYPAIIEAIEEIENHQFLKKACLCGEYLRSMLPDVSTPQHLLDMGCGCGNLIEALKCRYCLQEKLTTGEWYKCCCGNLLEIARCSIPNFTCYGVDINPSNIEAAEEKELPNIYLGDSEKANTILPPDVGFDIIIFSGLLNRQVTTKAKALAILKNNLTKLKQGGHVIISGYTSCHLSARDLNDVGIEVIRMSLPENLFKDYMHYALRQLYVGRKI